MKRKLINKKVKHRVAATKDVTAHKKRIPFPTFNLLITILLWLSVTTFFYSGRFVRPQELALGQQAPDTIVSSVDFQAESLLETQLKQREKAEKILPVFSVDRSGISNARKALIKLIPNLKTMLIAGDPERHALLADNIEYSLDLLSIPLTVNELLRIVPSEEIDLLNIIISALTPPIESGMVNETDLLSRFNGVSVDGNVAVRGITETIRPLNSFLAQPKALQEAVDTIAAQLPRTNRDKDVIRALITPWMLANVIYDAKETVIRRNQAIELVDPEMETIEQGSVLIRNGDNVSEQTLIWLAAHEERLSEMETPAEQVQRLIASGLLLLLGLGLAAAIAGIIQHPLLRDSRHVLLLLILSVLPLLTGKLLLYLSTNLQLFPTSVLAYSIPISIAPILAAILVSGSAGLLVGLWVSFALAALLGNSFEVFTLGLLVSVTAVYSTRDAKRRMNLFRAGLIIGAVKILFTLILAVLNQPSWMVLLPQLAAALLSGLTSALLALLLIPLFEHLFKITTDIRLLELSDLSHPLLQSLAMNAPGTYHHSLMMASLAQNAAESIGANGLQLRVCAYFHDIGKLIKPGFFSENIQFAENPHDDLSPSMSTLVIVSHVKEGVTLAKKHKLPQVVIDGIEQHQGTSLVSVFYHRAKTQQQKEQASTNSSGQVSDQDFRYEGPRPQNREMAILMLADSCEAASRSLEKPTSVRLSNLIGDIFNSRLNDGQLNECNLTLAELTTVKESFVFTLTNMLHGRVAYPKEGEEDKTPKSKPAEESKESE